MARLRGEARKVKAACSEVYSFAFTALDARWCKFERANHAPVLGADLEAFAQDPACL